jgi:hypothetical protein
VGRDWVSMMFSYDVMSPKWVFIDYTGSCAPGSGSLTCNI